MKYLLILVLTVAVIWLWQGKRRAALAEKRREKAGQKAGQKPPGRSRQLQATKIVACDVCALHLPRAEALTRGDGVYCSEAHRRQGAG